MITRTPVTHDFDIRPLPVLLLIVGRVRVRIPLEGLVAVLGVQLVWAQQPLAGQRGLVGFQILPPLGLIVGDIALRLSIIGIPGSTEGVVDRPWGALVRSELVVPADQEVPLHWELANEGVVLDPGEAVQKAAGGRLELTDTGNDKSALTYYCIARKVENCGQYVLMDPSSSGSTKFGLPRSRASKCKRRWRDARS